MRKKTNTIIYIFIDVVVEALFSRAVLYKYEVYVFVFVFRLQNKNKRKEGSIRTKQLYDSGGKFEFVFIIAYDQNRQLSERNMGSRDYTKNNINDLAFVIILVYRLELAQFVCFSRDEIILRRGTANRGEGNLSYALGVSFHIFFAVCTFTRTYAEF